MSGARGPQSLPANVHMLRGNASKLKLDDLLSEFNPEVEAPSCPRHLWPEAKKEWRRISTELLRYGLLSRLDRAALSMYCQSWARLVWAEEMLSRAMQQAEEKRLVAEEKGEEWKGGDGFMIPTPNGSFTYSPYWVAARRATQETNWYLASFGMSPASRGRVKTSDNRQQSLPLDGDGNSAWDRV